MQSIDQLRNATSISQEITTEKRRPGRPALSPEEKARRQAEQKDRYRSRGDARRRAMSILQKRHADEFKSILEEQLNSSK